MRISFKRSIAERQKSRKSKILQGSFRRVKQKLKRRQNLFKPVFYNIFGE
jgi:hypothetical protein